MNYVVKLSNKIRKAIGNCETDGIVNQALADLDSLKNDAMQLKDEYLIHLIESAVEQFELTKELNKDDDNVEDMEERVDDNLREYWDICDTFIHKNTRFAFVKF